MASFHPLTVTAIEKTTRDAVAVTLAPPEGAPFGFVEGQYLTFRRSFDGVELRRCYSLCAGADEGRLRVGIKRVEGGAFSTWANEDMRVGDVLDAMPPMGSFRGGATGGRYLAFAGGSGITPVLSILRTVLAREPEARFTLVYANRAVNTIMFREELDDLKNRHMGRLTIIHVLEAGGEEIDLFTGRVDAEKCTALFRHWIEPEGIDAVFICGPEPMMLAIRGALLARGMDASRIRVELFAGAQQGRVARPVSSVARDAAPTQARILLDGVVHVVDVPAGTSVLEAALAQEIEVPHACKAGVCSTCRARVREGTVEMIANHALEDNEVADGYVLTCQSYPLDARIVVDYDA